jgi:hypothetical protein
MASNNILTDRDTNAQIARSSPAAEGGDKVKSMEYHRQVLESRVQDGKYVVDLSPMMHKMQKKTNKHQN